MCEEESSLTSQCLAFCQTLASQGKAFTFSLKINSTSFSLDTRENQVPTQAVRKKISPSTKRRNARRRQELLKKEADLLATFTNHTFHTCLSSVYIKPTLLLLLTEEMWSGEAAATPRFMQFMQSQCLEPCHWHLEWFLWWYMPCPPHMSTMWERSFWEGITPSSIVRLSVKWPPWLFCWFCGLRQHQRVDVLEKRTSWFYSRNGDLRWNVARNLLFQIYALFGRLFPGFKNTVVCKKWQIWGMTLTLTISHHLGQSQDPKQIIQPLWLCVLPGMGF